VGADGFRELDRELEAWFANDPNALARGAHLWRSLLDSAPVHRHRGMVVVTSYEMARSVMRDHDRFSSDVSTQGDRARHSARSATSTESLGSLDKVVAFEAMLMNRRDGAAQAELRAPFAASMVRRRVVDVRHVIESEVEGVVASMAEGRRLDVEAFARELTGRVICRLIGAPVADRKKLQAWVAPIAEGRHNVEPGAVDPAHRAWCELAQYVGELVEDLRASRDDGPLAQALLASSDEGADGSARVAAHLMSLLGGQDSTATVISRGIGAMLSSGDQWRHLAEEPELASNAVEEAIRFVSPSQALMRRATVATRLDGVLVQPEETVVVVVAAANRDPKVFDEPERFDVERQNANRHLGFGYGRHHCVGVWLARAQIAAAFGLLAVRHPGLNEASVATGA
jgi:cytochrome P450